MKYAVVTFGCRVNQADSLAIEEALQQNGATPAAGDAADLIVVNTCSVTSSADQGARQVIRRLARSNPDARVVVTGCYATRRPDELRSLANVLRVVPNDRKEQLVADLFEGEEWTASSRFGDGEGPCGAPIVPGFAGRTAFTLRVQTGCAEPCTYCIIPATRGAPRSARPRHVLADIQRAADAGFREIVLTGVHLGSYGRDLTPHDSLEALLDRIACWRREHGQDVLFRISSLEPMDCTPAIVGLIESAGGFAPHFHLPLQHASGRILAAMRRPYRLDHYHDLVTDIRTRIPHAAIGTDVIAGFPGESDDDFALLVDWLQTSPVTHVHVFPYSDRAGTPASSLTDRVPGAVIRERSRILRDLSTKLTRCFRQSQIGSVHEVLTLEDGRMAVTGNYLKLGMPPGYGRNEWVRVRIEESSAGLYGVVTPALLPDAVRLRAAALRR
jgi:threonylcarbamoyladenosine tRNA methylthiotransferase MtaB